MSIPEDYNIETVPELKEIKSKFGIYKSTYQVNQDSKILYKRTLEIFKGNFSKEDYTIYRDFIRNVAKADKTSLVIIKNQ